VTSIFGGGAVGGIAWRKFRKARDAAIRDKERAAEAGVNAVVEGLKEARAESEELNNAFENLSPALKRVINDTMDKVLPGAAKILANARKK
jgi:hypothetical protein